jgi:hypothetical protein
MSMLKWIMMNLDIYIYITNILIII